MIKLFLKWLNTPYYFNSRIKFKLQSSLILGFSVFVFLYVFKPFGLSNFTEILLKYALGIGFITFLVSFLIVVIPPLIFKKFFNEDTWNIGKNILLIIVSILIVGSILWCFTYFYKKENGEEHVGLIEFLYYSFLVGAIPVFLLIFINEKKVREKRIKRAKEISLLNNNKIKLPLVTLKKSVTIRSDNGKEKLTFLIEDLVYITSEGNYASFFIKQNGKKLKEKILRVTLAKINEDLEPYQFIIRCHKSYIINSNYISNISGNARGYLLKSELIPFEIPVSRRFTKKALVGLIS